jgi:putative oxidoreductase
MALVRTLAASSPRAEALGWLFVRACAGLFVAAHGYAKLSAGLGGFAIGLARKGFPTPNALAVCAVASELVGGVLVAMGLFTRPAAASLTVTMVVAWASTHLGDAANLGQPSGGKFEYPFLLSVVFASLALAGAGSISLDRRLFSKRGSIPADS